MSSGRVGTRIADCVGRAAVGWTFQGANGRVRDVVLYIYGRHVGKGEDGWASTRDPFEKGRIWRAGVVRLTKAKLRRREVEATKVWITDFPWSL